MKVYIPERKLLKKSNFSYIIVLRYEVYWDPGKEKVMADYVVTTTTPIPFMSILNVLSIYLNNRKFVETNVQGGALIALTLTVFTYIPFLVI